MAVPSTSATLAKAIRNVFPKDAGASLSNKGGTLFEVLSRQAQDGVGTTVYQKRWTGKGIVGSHWRVTRVSLKSNNAGVSGKAWGTLVWKGKEVGEKEERIRGGLKYTWANGTSGPLPKTTQPAAVSAVLDAIIPSTSVVDSQPTQSPAEHA